MHGWQINTKKSGDNSHAEGWLTTASRGNAHAEGEQTTASGGNAHAEGCKTTASGGNAHAEGYQTTASGGNSYAEGLQTIASGNDAHAGGQHTIASAGCQMVIGSCNVEYGAAIGYVNENAWFIIGKSLNQNARANAFRVASNGVFASGGYSAAGADYAELFEWVDGNPDAEDRVGRFVTLDGEKIRLAGPEDDYILGIVSGSPSVVGDVHDDQWQGMYLYDVFGRPIWEEPPAGEDGDEEQDPGLARADRIQKLNPDYDNSQKYIPRTQRPEWDAVGMLGKLVAVDDGTCQVNGWCQPGEGSAATASAERTKYRVMARLDDTHIRVMIL